MQQWRVGVQSNIEFEPRKQFLVDLTKEIQQQQADNFEVLIMGDFNTEIFHRETKQFMEDCGLVDLHEPFMDPVSTTTPNTYITGSHKIDHIFGSDFFLYAMRQGGMILPFEQSIADHRVLILDLCQSKLQATNQDLTIPEQRLLNSKSPNKVELYVEILEQKMEEAKIEERLYRLCQRAQQPAYKLTARDETKYQRIDQQMTELMRFAEKQCGKKRNGYCYSPALARAGKMITALKQRRRTVIITELNIAGTEAEKAQARAHLDEINKELGEAWTNLKLTQQHSRELRDKHLENRAKIEATRRNTLVEKIILEMRNSERSEKSWTKLKHYLGDPKSGQLDRILLHDDNMREVSDPTEMHNELIRLSTVDMNLPEGSPFTVAPLDEIIPPWDPSPVNDQILDGTYQPPDDSKPEIKELFQHLVAPTNIDTPTDTLQIELTTEQFRKAVKIRRERTSSSPSGRHIGHYKAALLSERLTNFHTNMINFARKHNCPPERWMVYLQLRLEKLAGIPRTDKLRMIQLAEFDMNLQFGITIGREMIWNIEDNGLFEKIPQDGARPNRTSQTCGIRKVLSRDYIRVMKINAALIVTDLSKCYDSIHPGLAVICAQRHGVPKPITDLKLNILRRMSFKLKTAYGIAKTSFGNIDSKALTATHKRARIFGVGQGMQDSGALWISLWAPLYRVLDTVRPGAKFCSANGDIISERKGEALIDDLDLLVTETTLADNSINTVTAGATELYQKWTDTSQLGGTRLNQSKGRWYLYYWIWDNGKARLASIDESPAELTVRDDGVQTTIKRMEPNIGTRMLGYRLDPECNENDEYKFRTNEIKEFINKFNIAPINRMEAKLAHEGILVARLGYILAMTTFDDKRCLTLQRLYEPTVMKKRGFNRSMPLAIRYGPTEYAGQGIQQVADTQGALKVLCFIEHLRAGDDAGIDMIIQLSILQMEAGICQPVLESPITAASKYITRTWLSVLWSHLHKHNLQLHVPDAWRPQPQRINDQSIMAIADDIFGTGRRYRELQQIQACRLYLRVTMLSEIVDATGRRLCIASIRGERHGDRTTRLRYPNAPVRPPETFWRVWKKFLKALVSNPSNSIREPLKPTFQLGAWHNTELEEWKTRYSATTERLYIQYDNRMWSYPRRNTRTPSFNKHAPQLEDTFPANAVPMSVISMVTLVTTGIASYTSSCPQDYTFKADPNSTHTTTLLNDFSHCPNLPDQLYDAIHNTPSWTKAYMQNLQVCENFEANYLLAYHKGTLRSASDGSAPYHGSFAWKIIDHRGDGTTLAQGGGTCQRFPGLTSHRMEAAGMLGADLFLAQVQSHLQLPEYRTTIEHLCDNLEAVKRYNKAQRRHLTSFGLHDMDIHMAIADNQSNLPPRIAKWVKGHQDDNCDVADLSADARLNVEVDALADEFYSTTPSFLPPPPTVALYSQHIPITWNTRRFLQHHHGEQALRKRIMEKHPHWDNTTFNNVAWPSFKSAYSKLKEYERTRIIKFANRWSASAVRMNDWKRSVNPRCPNCPRTDRLPSPYDEDENHVLRCTHARISEARCMALARLEQIMKTMDTPRDISIAIIHGLNSWFENEQYNGDEPDIAWPPPNFTYHPQHHAAIQETFQKQSEIGWDEFLRGRISSDWGELVQTYYQQMNLGDRRNKMTWETQIIRTTWRIFFDTWQIRNELLHGADKSENQQIKTRDIDQQIRRAYMERNFIAPQHRGLYTSVNDTLSTNYATKVQWLHTIQCAKNAWINHLTENTATLQDNIDNPPLDN